MTIETTCSTNTCAQPDTKFYHNPNPNPTTKQHAVVNIQLNIQGGPKKVSHYRESSLNRIKNRQPG